MSENAAQKGAAAAAKTKKHANYARLHDAGGKVHPHETVLYRFETGAGFSKRSAAADGRSAHAVIVPRKVIRTAGLVERIVRMSRSADRDQVASVINNLMKTVADELRIGNAVVLDGWCSVRTYVEGRFDPADRKAVQQSNLEPRCRFTPDFRRRVNDGARLACTDALGATTVRVDAVTARPGVLFADGNFHGDHRITAGILLADGAEVPCRVLPKHSARSTRYVSDCLEIYPQTPLPEGAATLVLNWTDGSGEAQEARYPVTVQA